MTNTPDFTAMAQAARDARQREEIARQNALTEQLELAAGEAYNQFSDLFDSTDLDHNTKMDRFDAAVAALKGEAASTTTAPAASSDVLDLSTLDETPRQVIELVRDNPRRFKIEEFGAVKDTDFQRLRRNHEAAQAAAAGSDNTSPTATQPAAKKTAAPAKKAAATPDTADTTKAAEPKKTGSAIRRVVGAGLKAAAANAKN